MTSFASQSRTSAPPLNASYLDRSANGQLQLLSASRHTEAPNRRRLVVRPQAVAAPLSRTTRGRTPDIITPISTPTQPAVTPDVAADLYKDMFLGRIFESTVSDMFDLGHIFGFVHLYSGQEAVSAGVIRHLRRDDYICSTYRAHVHALSKNVPPRQIMAEIFGKKTGICRGQGGSMHLFSKKYNMLGGFGFLGESIPIGLGAAYQIRYRKEVLGDKKADQVSINFLGDGTTNIGQFAECLNMASLYKLPCIFVVENNKWAIGMPHHRATAPSQGDSEPHIYKKGPAYGMPGVLVDGMDVLKVRKVAAEAIARARRGDGPTLIEADTYRFNGHFKGDPDPLRKDLEMQQYMDRDPIPLFKRYILEMGVLSELQIRDIEYDVARIVDEAVRFAEESPKPDKAQLLENVFTDPRGFGIAPDGRYRYQLPGFTAGTAQVS